MDSVSGTPYVSGEQRRDVTKLPKIAIVVLHWNHEPDTMECLESLRHSRYENLQIIVVDNASAEAFDRLLQDRFPGLEVIRNPTNLGFPGGMNVGIRRALSDGADIVVCLNNDTVVDVEFMGEIAAAYRARPDAAALAPLELQYFNSATVVSLGGRIGLLRSEIGFYGKPASAIPDEIRTTGMLCGACMVFASATLKELGLFEPEYFFGFEDREYGMRILKSGREILLAPRARFRHKRAHSTGSKFNSMRAYFEVRNWILFARREFPLMTCAVFALYLTLGYLPYVFWSSLSNGGMDKALWSLKGVLWHINRSLLPPDNKIVEMLATGRN
jgi:GT2 family glycosyltransferase